MKESFLYPEGVSDVERLGDKLAWWRKRTKPVLLQKTVYCSDSEPLLYQEMLKYKASQASRGGHGTESDDSDFEIVGQGYYGGESDSSSPYYTEEDEEGRSSPFSPPLPPPPLASTVAEVTVEFQPLLPTTTSNSVQVVMDAEDNTHTFLSFQPSSPPPSSEQTPPPSLLGLALDRTPSPQQGDTALFYTPPLSHTHSRLSASCENFTQTTERRSESRSPRRFLTPESDSPQQRILDDTHFVQHTGQSSRSSLLSLPAGGGAEFRTPITGLPSQGSGEGEEKTPFSAMLAHPVPWTAASST